MPSLLRLAAPELCDDMNLTVAAAAGTSGPMTGTVRGTNGGGTVEGIADVSFGPLEPLRNGQADAPQQEHRFSTADGTFTLAGDGRLSPVSGRPGILRVNQRLPVATGTRLFLDATGNLRIEGEWDVAAGTVTYTARGRLCRTAEGWVDPID